jgi:hypothetical protein
MKREILLFFSLLFSTWAGAQGFQEICGSAQTNGTIVDFQYYKDTLYSTGFFTRICDEPAGYIARWDNNSWQAASIDIEDPGHALRVINDQMFIAKYVESIDSNWVYFYDNAGLQTLGAGVYLTTASGFSELPNMYDIIEYDGKIVACGEFDRVGSESIQGIMQWNGSKWESLGTGLSDHITGTAAVIYPHQMMVYKDELYVVGNFKYAGDVEVNGVAKWNGSEWSAMGEGFNNTLYGINVYKDQIIVGGSFSKSGETHVNCIAKWDGEKWIDLGFGFTSTSAFDYIFVHSLEIIDELLYIGGGLKQITFPDNTTLSCNGIVAYDGNTLDTFDGGVEGRDIEAIQQMDDGKILIGGGVWGNGYTGIRDLASNAFELDDDIEVRIFPNPVNERIHISTKHRFDKYQILDGMGQVLISASFENSFPLLLSPGVYFLRLTDGNNYRSTHKLIKQ